MEERENTANGKTSSNKHGKIKIKRLVKLVISIEHSHVLKDNKRQKYSQQARYCFIAHIHTKSVKCIQSDYSICLNMRRNDDTNEARTLCDERYTGLD